MSKFVAGQNFGCNKGPIRFLHPDFLSVDSQFQEKQTYILVGFQFSLYLFFSTPQSPCGAETQGHDAQENK